MNEKSSIESAAIPVVYDTYILVDEEPRPFTIFRVDTTKASAINVREHLKKLVLDNSTGSDTYDDTETVKFFIDFQAYLTTDVLDADESDREVSDRFEEVQRLIPNRDEWSWEFRDRLPPMWCDWTSANTLILNPWR